MVWLLEKGMELKKSRWRIVRFLGNLVVIVSKIYAAWIIMKAEKKQR